MQCCTPGYTRIYESGDAKTCQDMPSSMPEAARDDVSKKAVISHLTALIEPRSVNGQYIHTRHNSNSRDKPVADLAYRHCNHVIAKTLWGRELIPGNYQLPV